MVRECLFYHLIIFGAIEMLVFENLQLKKVKPKLTLSLHHVLTKVTKLPLICSASLGSWTELYLRFPILPFYLMDQLQRQILAVWRCVLGHFSGPRSYSVLCPLSFVLCLLSFVLCPLSFVLCPLSFVHLHLLLI